MKIKMNKSTFKDTELVRLAARENNTKRGYLIVNPLQGKHMPVDPKKTLKMFEELASQVKPLYSNEQTLFIGFAETATAIGAAVAAHFTGSFYIHTSRETIHNAEKVVEFKEEHSHAVQQILYCPDWHKLTANIKQIIFVEDEISTGKTIANFVEALRKNQKVSSDMKFSACSLINGMSDEREAEFSKIGLDFTWLVKIFINNDCVSAENESSDFKIEQSRQTIMNIQINENLNPRKGVRIDEYKSAVRGFAERIASSIDFKGKSVAVIGTEEFMYPAIKLGEYISESCGANIVKTHSTTRSPIVPASVSDYPLQSRAELKSFYENGRTTYIYNMDKYDIVLTVSDSSCMSYAMDDLTAAFSECSNFIAVNWRNGDMQ